MLQKEVKFFLLLAISFGSAQYIPSCPGPKADLVITKEGMDKNIFVVLQIHEPANSKQIAYTHRRRFTMSKAARGIGTDPEVDFRSRKTLVFMDGYMDSANFITSRVLVGNWGYLGYNTIQVDAQALFSQSFPTVVRVVDQLGNITATLLSDLMQYGLKPRDILLLGISLGGQSISHVAKHFKRITGKKVGKIFSMDPAGPCYRTAGPEHRLSPNDADLVQVIHTGSDGFGNGVAQGHVDFYINGGEWQYALNTVQPICEDYCSHFASALYFYASLRLFPDKFVGIKCKNVRQAREHKCYDNYPHETNVMGLKVDGKKPGIYYVPVRDQAPFYAPDDWMETKTVYPMIHDDAMSEVEHFVLSERSLDLNLSPLESVNPDLRRNGRWG